MVAGAQNGIGLGLAAILPERAQRATGLPPHRARTGSWPLYHRLALAARRPVARPRARPGVPDQGGLNPFPPTDFVLSVAQVHGERRVLGSTGSLRVLGHLPDSPEHVMKLSVMG
jgi:hypothetical protein